MFLRSRNKSDKQIFINNDHASAPSPVGQAAASDVLPRYQEPPSPKHYDQGKVDGRSPIYLPVIFFLTCLVVSTLYLLRSDNSQLALAARTIQDMKQEMKHMQQQVNAGRSGFLFFDTDGGDDSVALSGGSSAHSNCEKEKAQIKDIQAQCKDLEGTLEELKAKVEQQQKVHASELESANSMKAKLEGKVANLHKEKRILSKRLGVKVGNEKR